MISYIIADSKSAQVSSHLCLTFNIHYCMSMVLCRKKIKLSIEMCSFSPRLVSSTKLWINIEEILIAYRIIWWGHAVSYVLYFKASVYLHTDSTLIPHHVSGETAQHINLHFHSLFLTLPQTAVNLPALLTAKNCVCVCVCVLFPFKHRFHNIMFHIEKCFI